MFDICTVGHITKDIIKTRTEEKIMPGGTGYYCSMALKSIGAKTALITKIGESDKGLLDDLAKGKFPFFAKHSRKTTVFENFYGHHIEKREQKVRAVADPFTLEDVSSIHSKHYHIGPLTKCDIPIAVLEQIAKMGTLSLDVQGCLRKIESAAVTLADWEEKERGRPFVNILKADENEARILTGKDEAKEAAIDISAYDVNEVIITLGSRGSMIYTKGHFHSIPAFSPRRCTDVTGCGDTYMAGYLYKRARSAGVKKAGLFAAAMATLKLERFGPFNGTEEKVDKFLEMQDPVGLSDIKEG